MGLGLFPSLAGYRRGWLQGDGLAGLTVWAVLVPEALAYATIAGVSPVVGLYAAPAALMLYAAFGCSRHLVVGPMSATAALSAAAVADARRLRAADARRADRRRWRSSPVSSRSIAGLARLGLPRHSSPSRCSRASSSAWPSRSSSGSCPSCSASTRATATSSSSCGTWSASSTRPTGSTLAGRVVSLALMLGLRRVAADGARLAGRGRWSASWPSSCSTWTEHGVDIVGNDRAGPPLARAARRGRSADYLSSRRPRSASCSSASPRASARPRPTPPAEHYEIDPNRELLGLGAANLGAGLSSGMVVNGSLSKTAVNGGAGARTQLSGLVVAALTVVTLLFLTGLFEHLPEATLGRGGDRRGDRAGRRPGPGRACTGSTPAGSVASTAWPPAPTSSPRWPPCSGYWSSTPCPGCSSASASRCCC